MNLLDFNLRLLLAILTCYRLARMVAKDDGPFFLFKRVRYWAKDKAYQIAKDNNGLAYWSDGKPIDERWFEKWHNLAEGLSCPYCTGVWLSLLVVALVLWPTYYGDLFLVLMAISAGQAFLQSLGRDG